MRLALLCLVAVTLFMVALGAWSVHPYAGAAVAAAGPFFGAAVLVATRHGRGG